LDRILGLDVGEKRTGIAISDPLGITAQPLECWAGDPLSDEFLNVIKDIVQSKNVKKIVVGLPKNLKNEDTLSTERARKVAQILSENTPSEIVLWDERMSTSQIGRMFQDLGVKKRKRKQKVDLLAAIVILQNYLDYMGNMR
jgi:putative Holliday junction resolvase